MANSDEKHNGGCNGKAIVSESESSGFFQGEGTSPDLLKNTPSNIARLEDVIEQCKGRQKYLARTRSPSDGEDVRWYFCKVPLAVTELAASVPRTEIVGKGDYFRFSMRDSLALEASFLQREEELLSLWWKEYAECSEGPSGPRITSRVTLDMQTKLGSFQDDQLNELYTVEEERVGVPVKGGLYEVDLFKRHCFPVYWHGENRRILRGHWFARKGSLDWLPLREDVAEQLELAYRCQVWHRRTFQPSGLFAARIDIQGITQGLHALFTGEDDTWEAWLGVDNSGFVGIRGNEAKLRRGFCTSGSSKPTQDELRQQEEEEMDDYCAQVPVGHLVFMVHGIGQRLEKANLVDDVGNFRHITESLAKTHLSSYQRSTQRVLFIPCQWRRGLKLGGESAVEKITLDGVRGLRVTLSATVHDVLYYMSPIYCQDIINSVSNQLNRLYKKFLKRNPGYNGKVSIYGHSLGSILSFDILCHQESLSSPSPLESVIRDEESQVDAYDQSVESSYPMASENNAISVDVENLEESKGTIDEERSMLNLDAMIHEDIVNDRSLTSDKKEGCTKNCGIPNPDEGLEDSLQLSTDDKLLDSMSSLEEDCQTLDLHSRGTCSTEQRTLDASSNVTSGVPDNNDADINDDSICEDINDKEQLLSLLEEEVKSLKAKLAELELKHSSMTSTHRVDNCSNEYCQGIMDGKATVKQSFPRKLSPEQDNSVKSYTPYIKYTKLDFKVDTFFAVGSPLGVFLALRNIRIGIGRGQEYWQDERISEKMPSCQQMFNIFHPFDPVAYRLEPLICKEYISKRPVLIPYHKGGKRLHIAIQEFTEDISSRSQAVVNHLNSVRVNMVNVFRSRNKDNREEAIGGVQVKERSYGSIMIERLTRSEDGRIDHMLQDKTFEHPYISALGSHTNYWRDYDTALFILKHLYHDIPEEPDTTDQANSEGSSESSRMAMGPFLLSEAMEDDIPLTFCSNSMIREFSRKAGKPMNAN